MAKDGIEELNRKFDDLELKFRELKEIYSLNTNLINSTQDEALKKIFNDEIETIKINSNESLEILGKAKDIQNFLQENSRFDTAKQILSDSILESIKDRTSKIESAYTKIFETENGNLSDIFSEMYENTKNAYNDLFVNKLEDKVKIQILNDHIAKIENKYKELISDQNSINNQITELNDDFINKKNELDTFYKKIFGDDKIKSLNSELDERLIQLKETEKEAKKVIDLSSDAGLGGGFFLKGKEAKNNKYVSLYVFVLILILMSLFNFNTIDFKNLKDIDLISILVRFMINIPFIWIATVANLNLNKYARLEQEYSHKESLAKSFERYKSEIEKLNETEVAKSKELLVNLMELNLEAFKINPSLTMDKAKSDMDLLEKIKLKPENTK
jgi:hypothetical protein